MDIMTYFLIAIIVLVVIFAKMALVIIPQSETKIVERLGKYYATLKPGINIIIPFIDRAKSIVVLNHGRYMYSTTIDLREQVYDFPKQNVITKDNVQTEINALLYFQIVDPFKATYEINNLPNAIEKLTQTTLRNIIGELELDETLTSRDTINKKLSAVLDDATDKWGVKVNRVELQDITPPATVLNAMEKQMQAERNKRAQILTSEGEKAADILASEGEKTAIINKAEAAKQQAILEAEGEAQARIRKAEAEAKAIELITEAVGKSTNPANYLLAQKYIQMMQELAEGDKTKTVYLPYEATNLLSLRGENLCKIGEFHIGGCPLIKFDVSADTDFFIHIGRNGKKAVAVFRGLDAYSVELPEDRRKETAETMISSGGMIGHPSIHESNLQSEFPRCMDQVRPDFRFEDHQSGRIDQMECFADEREKINGAEDDLNTFWCFFPGNFLCCGRCGRKHKITFRIPFSPFLDRGQSKICFAYTHGMKPERMIQ